MPQGRIVLKRICQSRKLAALKTDGARLLYTWLIPNVDVNGCFSADPQVIKGQIFTRLRKSTATIQAYLEDLADVGLILIYDVGGDLFLQIPNFAEKQPNLRADRESPTVIPLPSEGTPAELRRNSGGTPALSKVNISKVKVKQSKGEYTGEFENFWKNWKGRWNEEKGSYVKVGKFEAFQEWQKLTDDEKRKALLVAPRASGKYTPDACRWLGKRRFDDFPAVPKPKSNPMPQARTGDPVPLGQVLKGE